MNLMLVMLIGGLWHGASWNFVIWGVIHGTMLAFERMQGKRGPLRELAQAAGRVAPHLRVVCLAWAFFRAETLARRRATWPRSSAWRRTHRGQRRGRGVDVHDLSSH